MSATEVDVGKDKGTGLIGTAAAVLATVLFLTFACQLLVGLYASTALRGSLHDAAGRAARHEAWAEPAELDRLERRAEASLGRMGGRTAVRLEPVDVSGDGAADVVRGEAVSHPPRFVPALLGGALGVEEVRVGVEVRIERPR